MTVYRRMGRDVALGLLLMASVSVSACGSSGRGSFISGSSGAAVADNSAAGGASGAAGVNGSSGSAGGAGAAGGGGSTGPAGPAGPAGAAGSALDVVAQLGGGLLYTAGNATLVAPDLIGRTADTVAGAPLVGAPTSGLLNTVGGIVGATGTAVAGGGAAMVDGGAAGIANVNINGQTVAGSPGVSSAVGVGVLAPTPVTGQLASANVLSGGQTASLAVGAPATNLGSGLSGQPANSLLGLSANGHSLIGAGTSPLIGVAVGPGAPARGSLASAGIGSNGQAASLAVTGVTSGGSGLTGGLLAPVAPVLAPVTSSLGAATGPVSGGLGL